MSKIINELATIKVSDEMLQDLDMKSLFEKFGKTYKKLDGLKTFREEHDAKNFLMRFWDSDKLRDAQLDSAEVQAEFSKTIGQLMLLTIIQSKELTGQQKQLNEQQDKLKFQADEISQQTNLLQEQHVSLAEQSTKLKNLVNEYFELKGITEEGAQKLIDIASDIKSTKESILQEFSLRMKDVDSLHSGLTEDMGSLSAQVTNQLQLSLEQARSEFDDLQKETLLMLAKSESALRDEHEQTQQLMHQNLNNIEKNLRDAQADLLAKNNTLETSVSNLTDIFNKQVTTNQEKIDLIKSEQVTQSDLTTNISNDVSVIKTDLEEYFHAQNVKHQALLGLQHEAFKRIKRLGYSIASLSLIVLVALGAMAYLTKLL